jgi:outer membrane protein assembly factor BamB
VNSDEIVCLDKKDGSLQRLISPNVIHGRRLLEVHKNLPNHFFIDSGIAYSVSRDGKLYAIECESSKIIWSKKVNIATKFLVYKNNIYAITSNGELLALDKNNGSLVYAVDLISYLDKKEDNRIRHKWTRPILYNDKILVSNYSGELMIFDAYSGKIIAKSKEKHLITSSPFLSENYIYTISNNGFIYRYTYE